MVVGLKSLFPSWLSPKSFQVAAKTYQQFLGPCRVAPFIFKINGWESLSHQMPPHPFSLCVQEDLQFSRSVVPDSLRPHELQHARPPCPSQTLGVDSNSCPSSWWCHPAITSSVVPFSSCPQSFQASGLFQWINSLHEVAKVLQFQLQHQSFQWTSRTDLLQDRLVGSPCSPRDPQESSPTPQFKSINFLVLSFLHSPTLTSIHDHWKNHSLDQTDLCWQSNVSAF